MKKKGANKWFSTVSAAKFYGGLLVGTVCSIYALIGLVTKPLDEIINFDMLSLSPVMILLFAIIAFALARDAYKNQRW